MRAWRVTWISAPRRWYLCGRQLDLALAVLRRSVVMTRVIMVVRPLAFTFLCFAVRVAVRFLCCRCRTRAQTLR